MEDIPAEAEVEVEAMLLILHKDMWKFSRGGSDELLVCSLSLTKQLRKGRAALQTRRVHHNARIIKKKEQTIAN